MAVDQTLVATQDTIASISTAGLLGESYVSLSPGAAERNLPGGTHHPHRTGGERGRPHQQVRVRRRGQRRDVGRLRPVRLPKAPRRPRPPPQKERNSPHDACAPDRSTSPRVGTGGCAGGSANAGSPKRRAGRSRKTHRSPRRAPRKRSSRRSAARWTRRAGRW